MLGVDGWVWNKSLVVDAVHLHLLILLKAAAAGSPDKGEGLSINTTLHPNHPLKICGI